MIHHRKIERPAPDEYAPHFQRYLDKVPGDGALPLLAAQVEETTRLLRGLGESRALHRYAPEKWSVKETVVHLSDAERVFMYRALSFARNDRNELPGFEENEWVPVSGADARPIADAVDELRAVRAATLALAQALPVEALLRRGIASRHPLSVRAAFWIAAGHERHHLGLLRERYGITG
jgi:hypothetical protein